MSSFFFFLLSCVAWSWQGGGRLLLFSRPGSPSLGEGRFPGAARAPLSLHRSPPGARRGDRVAFPAPRNGGGGGAPGLRLWGELQQQVGSLGIGVSGESQWAHQELGGRRGASWPFSQLGSWGDVEHPTFNTATAPCAEISFLAVVRILAMVQGGQCDWDKRLCPSLPCNVGMELCTVFGFCATEGCSRIRFFLFAHSRPVREKGARRSNVFCLACLPVALKTGAGSWGVLLYAQVSRVVTFWQLCLERGRWNQRRVTFGIISS